MAQPSFLYLYRNDWVFQEYFRQHHHVNDSSVGGVKNLVNIEVCVIGSSSPKIEIFVIQHC